ILVLMAVASIAGLLIPGLYRDNAHVTAAWFGNDLATLVVAVPLLALSLYFSSRGSLRGRLVWLGMLDYALYNTSYYLFGTAFNSLFLIYVILFVLSMMALIFALAELDVDEIGQRFRANTPVRWIAGFMVFVAAGLTVVYSIESLRFVFTGQLPAIVTLTGKATSVVFALDLTLVVPWFTLGAVWLWQRKPWGYVIAAIWNVKGAVYMLALSAATVSAAVQMNAPEDLGQVGLWAFIGLGNLIAALLLLGRMRTD
ncbi:MAG: hypothetical protein PVI59_05900, partial [Anaerolineae bacterium]